MVEKNNQRSTDSHTHPEKVEDRKRDETLSLRGTLFSTIVFVGGGIVLWTGLLMVLFLMRA